MEERKLVKVIAHGQEIHETKKEIRVELLDMPRQKGRWGSTEIRLSQGEYIPEKEMGNEADC